ncbi:MAG: M23 family metallopeptidase [Gemmatimonadaceae bacterium]
MKKRFASWFAAAATLALGAAALTYGRPVPNRPAASVLAVGPRVLVPARFRIRTDSIRRGESVVAVLQRAGMAADDARQALHATTAIDPRKVPAGTTITTSAAEDAEPSEVVFKLSVDRLVRLSRSAANIWSSREERLQWTTDTVAVAGAVRTTLTAAIAQGATAFPEKLRTELAFALADILEYRIDLSRDLHTGDSIFVLLERQHAPNGMTRAGQILAARLNVAGKSIETVHFEGQSTRSAYFDGEGKSMSAEFLRAPLAFRRISSVFGIRKHPILGVWKQHTGTDYAASAGTPVRALGDGTVIYAGWKGGYGNVIEIRHHNGMITRYGHLRAFAAGIKNGASVAISRTIGFVGMTGLATAPHLHFEVLIDGVSKDSRKALTKVTGVPLAASDQALFSVLKNRLFASLAAHLLTSARPNPLTSMAPFVGAVTEATIVGSH